MQSKLKVFLLLLLLFLWSKKETTTRELSVAAVYTYVFMVTVH